MATEPFQQGERKVILPATSLVELRQHHQQHTVRRRVRMTGPRMRGIRTSLPSFPPPPPTLPPPPVLVCTQVRRTEASKRLIVNTGRMIVIHWHLGSQMLITCTGHTCLKHVQYDEQSYSYQDDRKSSGANVFMIYFKCVNWTFSAILIFLSF